MNPILLKYFPSENRNIISVVQETSKLLEGKEIPAHELDHQWISRFFHYVQDVYDEEMQILWAKVLAREIECKGSISLRTLRVLSEFDQETYELFRRLCSVCFFLPQYPADGKVIDARLLINVRIDELPSGLNYDPFNRLSEYELIILNLAQEDDYSQWTGIKVNSSPFKVPGLTITLEDKYLPCIVRIPFEFQNKYWLLNPLRGRERQDTGKIFTEATLTKHQMTRAGLELSRVIELEPMEEFAKEIFTYFKSEGLQMMEVLSLTPKIVKTS